MTVQVGVIGAGKIGQEHIRRLTETLPGAKVVAVSDADGERAGGCGEGREREGLRNRRGAHRGEGGRGRDRRIVGRHARGLCDRGD